MDCRLESMIDLSGKIIMVKTYLHYETKLFRRMVAQTTKSFEEIYFKKLNKFKQQQFSKKIK